MTINHLLLKLNVNHKQIMMLNIFTFMIKTFQILKNLMHKLYLNHIILQLFIMQTFMIK